MKLRMAMLASTTVLFALASGGASTGHDSSRPSHIHAGACPSPGQVAAALADVTAPSGEPAGAASSIPVEVGIGSVDLSLSDILATDHSIVVHHAPDDMDTYLVCGDIGGVAMPLEAGTSLAVGLASVGDSTFSGVGLLTDTGAGTTAVSVFITDRAMAGHTVAGLGRAPEGTGAEAIPGTEGSPRAIAIAMTDDLRFFPDTITVSQGETIRFLVDNPTSETHDFTLGDIEAQQRHGEEMATGEGHAHGHGASVSELPRPVMLGPGESAEVIATFAEAGELLIGCHVPGHWEAGMRATVVVLPSPPPG